MKTLTRGTILKSYKILDRLGKGAYSKVYLCKNIKDNTLCAVKIQKSDKESVECATKEIRLLKKINFRDTNNIVKLLESFTSDDGHICMVFELLGNNLYHLIKGFYPNHKMPLSLVKNITKQLILTLISMHDCKMVHTDFRPENILLDKFLYDDQFIDMEGDKGDKELLQKHIYKTNENIVIKLADFGLALNVKDITDEDINVQVRTYRAPEVIYAPYSNLEKPFGIEIDIWSLGCTVFELLTGDSLFNPEGNNFLDTDDDHLLWFYETLGNLPDSFKKRFTKTRVIMKYIIPWKLEDVFVEKYHYSREESKEMCSFLLPLLEFDPKNRPYPKDILKHKWLNNSTNK